MVTACGHVEEGPSVDKLHLRISRIMSSMNDKKVKCHCNLWSLPVVKRSEGFSSDKLHFGVSGIVTWRVEMPHLQIHEMRNCERTLCISVWSHLVFTPSKRWREKYVQTSSFSAFRWSRLGKSRNFTMELTKRWNVKLWKAHYEQALGHIPGHIKEGAIAEKLCFRVSELATWRVKMPHCRISELRKCETGK